MDVISRYKGGEKQEHVQRISSVGRDNDANKQQNKKTNGPKMIPPTAPRTIPETAMPLPTCPDSFS